MRPEISERMEKIGGAPLVASTRETIDASTDLPDEPLIRIEPGTLGLLLIWGGYGHIASCSIS